MTGDQTDILQRVQSALPPWFGDAPANLQAMLQSEAWNGAFIYSLIQYLQLQTRIKTATDGNLDLIANDFFGTTLLRKADQPDASFRAQILINLLRERATRKAVVQVLTDITGRAPQVFEPARPADTGAYGTNTIGYRVAGGYGSLMLPYQAFINAYRQPSSGIPYVGGYGSPVGGYGIASQLEYASLDMVQGAVTDADIYAAIDAVKPEGTILWVSIASNPPPGPSDLDSTFVLDQSALL